MKTFFGLFAWTLLQVALGYNFSDYTAEFNKSYSTSEELSLRKSNFDANYSRILDINSQNLGYGLAVNEMTDWSQAEVNGKRQANSARLGFRSDSNSPGSQTFSLDIGAPNASVDWRDKGAISSVKNQGSCGSCWAFASAAVYESFMLQVESKSYDFSEEYLLECTSGNSCDGGRLSETFKVLQAHGMPTEASYPYAASHMSTGKPSTTGICSAETVHHTPKYTAYSVVNVDVEPLKAMLNVGTLAVGMEATDIFLSYSSGIFRCQYQTGSSFLNHAVQLIGYDSSGNWIIKNSWGTTWGINGFGYITSDTVGNCGIGVEVYRLSAERLGMILGVMLGLAMATM